MPLYQYVNKAGHVLELIRPVERRDYAPAGYSRVTVPVSLGVAGTSSDPVDEHSADGQVPRALKELGNNRVNNMVKESGFSVDKFRKVWGL